MLQDREIRTLMLSCELEQGLAELDGTLEHIRLVKGWLDTLKAGPGAPAR